VWRVTITGQDGVERDVSQLVASACWAGSYDRCARTLDLSLAVSQVDKGLPRIPCGLGSLVRLYTEGELRFEGYLFSRTRDTGSNTVEVGCADRGLYLKRNQASYKFKQSSPEAITRRVCGEFGIQVGELAATGVTLSRNFPGVSLYQIIQTAYTQAALTTGERYVARFRGATLEVKAKKQSGQTLVVRPGSNLITLTDAESVENMVNRVEIRDKNGNRVTVQGDEEAQKLYGVFQSSLQQSESSSREAAALLEDNGVSQKLTVELLGNPALIAGECVVLQEPITGQYGLFWIDGDTHTWKNGLYQTKLVLNFRNLMDEQEAGRLPGA
jgi:hypothetical protein